MCTERGHLLVKCSVVEMDVHKARMKRSGSDRHNASFVPREKFLTAGVFYFRRDESVHCLLANTVHALVEVWQALITDFGNPVLIYFLFPTASNVIH